MKKYLLLISCLFLSVLAVALFSCGGGGSNTPAPHEHVYSETWSYNGEVHFHRATCHPEIVDEEVLHELGEEHFVEENGIFYKQRDCVCGYKEREVHLHEFYDGAIVKEPTCTEYGAQEIICSVCGYVSTKSIMYLYHDLEYYGWQDSTCTEVGWEAYEKCTRCDYTTYVEIPAKQHDLSYYGRKEPTCTEVGWETYEKCNRCDYTTYVEIPATGHSYASEWSYDEYYHWHEPTCGHYDYDAYNKKYHEFGEWETVTPAGLVDDGTERRTCTECGYYEDKVIPRLCYVSSMGSNGWRIYRTNDLNDYLKGDVVIPAEKDGLPIREITGSFNNLTEVTSVTIPKGVYKLENSFQNCPNLKTIYWDAEHYTANIGVDITDSGSMFYYVEKVVITENGNLRCFDPIYSDEQVPSYLKNVYSFEVAENNPNHKIEKASVGRGGTVFDITVLMTKDGSGLCAIPRRHYGETLYLNNLTFDHVASYAFYKAQFGRIDLPNTVEVIGSGAYTYSEVSTITIPESVKSINTFAFSHCANLTTLYWNAIDGQLVAGNATGFFNGCTALTTLRFGSKVSKIYSFYGTDDCTSLTNVRYDGDVKGWNSITKPTYWKCGILANEVVCTNGKVPIL